MYKYHNSTYFACTNSFFYVVVFLFAAAAAAAASNHAEFECVMPIIIIKILPCLCWCYILGL